MQLSQSTVSPDPNLTTLLFPAPAAGSASGVPAATAPAEAGAAFELLFSELPPPAAEPAAATTSPETEAAICELLLGAGPRLFDFAPPETRGDDASGADSPQGEGHAQSPAAITAVLGFAPKETQPGEQTAPDSPSDESRDGAISENVATCAHFASPSPTARSSEGASENEIAATRSEASMGFGSKALAGPLRAAVSRSEVAHVARPFFGLPAGSERAPGKAEPLPSLEGEPMTTGTVAELPEAAPAGFWQPSYPLQRMTPGVAVRYTADKGTLPNPELSTAVGARALADPGSATQPVPSAEAVSTAAMPAPLQAAMDAPRERLASSLTGEASNSAMPSLENGGKGASAGEENFAGMRDERFSRESAQSNGEVKSFLTTRTKAVASRPSTFGISVAQPLAPMVAHSNFHVSPTPSFDYAGSALTAAELGEFAPAPAAPAEASSAHRAVEAILKSVDELSAREQTTVTLRFSVAGEDLSVRIELRDDQVSTTFRTDSAELRAVLSQEWQAVTSATGDRAVRMAPAVFSANDSSQQNAFAGDTASRHREQQARQGGEAAGVVRTRSTRGASSVALGESVRTAGPAASATALHLHTLA